MRDGLRSGVSSVFSTRYAFAALKEDGSVVTWGKSSSGGNSSAVKDEISGDVESLYSTRNAFSALKQDGSVVSWGQSEYGGDFRSAARLLQNDVVDIYTTGHAFAALKADGSVVTWGNKERGGDSRDVAQALRANVATISNPYRLEFSQKRSLVRSRVDQLTGRIGRSDTFIVGNLRKSTIDGFDVITNFEPRDRIAIADQTFAATIDRYAGTAERLNASQVDRALGGPEFLPGQVAAIRVDGFDGTFVVVNSKRPGFQLSQDTMFLLVGYQIDAMNPVVIV